jgi:hypothetical protein
MLKGSTREPFMPAEHFEAFTRQMLAAGAISNSNDLAALFGTQRRSVNRMRELGGDRILALACAALINDLEPFAQTIDADKMPALPKRVGSGRLPGPRPSKLETEAAMRARIEAELRAKYGLPPMETEEDEVAA